jgi:hypothetical protein
MKLLASCSKQAPKLANGLVDPNAETIPIGNFKFKNCHFLNPTPSYTFGAKITPNIIQCDEGVAKSVQPLNPAKLPAGIYFDPAQLALVGTANERVVQAPYDFYLENESGYVIIKIQISIQ